jgi:hypothetical protein
VSSAGIICQRERTAKTGITLTSVIVERRVSRLNPVTMRMQTIRVRSVPHMSLDGSSVECRMYEIVQATTRIVVTVATNNAG